jgi:hypothetical protein
VLQHQQIVALGFRVAGCVLGIPSLLLFLDVTINLIALSCRPVAQDKSKFLDVTTYGLVGMLTNSAQVVGNLLGGISEIASWIMTMVAILALLISMFALFVYITGTGIEHHATWARIIAMLMSAAFVVISLVALTIVPRGWMPLPCLAIGASSYVLWVLGWKFS